MNEQFSRVCALINLDNVKYNINNIVKAISPSSSLYAIIKADGYGHGAIALAREYEQIEAVRGYGVATAEEAMQLVEADVKKDILIIGYTFPYSYEQLISNNVRLTVFRPDMAIAINEVAARLGKKAYVHIKVDTGMSRIGIMPDENGMKFFEDINKLSNIEIEGIFTHFARADETDKKYAYKQFEVFSGFVNSIEKKYDFSFKIKHCCNSAAIIEMPDCNMDAVRAGIILYGLQPSDEVDMSIIDVKPVMSLVSHIIHIKEVPANTSVSYGGTYVTDKATRIATIPVGYADGYQRRLSGKASVLINKKRVPVLGRICMDQFMVDVTDVPDCKVGDSVTLIGSDGDERITIEELSSLSEQLNYEFSCDIGKRVPRVYIKDDKCLYE